MIQGCTTGRVGEHQCGCCHRCTLRQCLGIGEGEGSSPYIYAAQTCNGIVLIECCTITIGIEYKGVCIEHTGLTQRLVSL